MKFGNLFIIDVEVRIIKIAIKIILTKHDKDDSSIKLGIRNLIEDTTVVSYIYCVEKRRITITIRIIIVLILKFKLNS